MSPLRVLLGSELVVFAAAALVHAGVLLGGHRHRQASIAESVIAGVLAIALIVSVTSPGLNRAVGLGAQSVALLGTLVGAGMIAIGVGPQSALDLVLHACMIALLAAGLVAAARHHPDARHP